MHLFLQFQDICIMDSWPAEVPESFIGWEYPGFCFVDEADRVCYLGNHKVNGNCHEYSRVCEKEWLRQ